VADINFAVDEMKKIQPHANYDKLTMVGHSMGGDISMYFAKEFPDQIKKVVTLDNLRVPFMTDAKFKILSFRSKDTQFKPDPGVVPDAEQCEKSDITVVDTDMQHNDMRDTGPDKAKTSIQTMLDKFLNDTDSALSPVDTKKPGIIEPGSVAPAPSSLLAPPTPSSLSALSPASKSPRAVTN
jgi:pimeloyl-ACP methyl ester carboxylesterase